MMGRGWMEDEPGLGRGLINAGPRILKGDQGVNI